MADSKVSELVANQALTDNDITVIVQDIDGVLETRKVSAIDLSNYVFTNANFLNQKTKLDLISVLTEVNIDTIKNKLEGIEEGATEDQEASEVPYSNVSSLLTATTIQGAVDEMVVNAGTNKAKLDTIEDGATADQTDEEIKTAYENNADTNPLTDTLLDKINNIEVGATADQSANEVPYANTTSGLLSTTVQGSIDELKGNIDTKSESATTLTGYGITDAYTKTQTDTNISTAVSSLVDSSPAALDTLNELATAIGDDANFASTMTTALGNKADTATTYTKTETTTLLDAKANTDTTYTKTEVDSYLGNKEDAGVAYTKGDTDTLLNQKVSNSKFLTSNSSNPIPNGGDDTTINAIGYVQNINELDIHDGALFSQAWGTAYQHQIFGDYRTGRLASRGKNNGTWTDWEEILRASDSPLVQQVYISKSGMTDYSSVSGYIPSFAVSITPKNATNKVKISVLLNNVTIDVDSGYTWFELHRNGTMICVFGYPLGWTSTDNDKGDRSLVFFEDNVSANTEYSVYYNNTQGSGQHVQVNRDGRGLSTIVLEEYRV